MENQFIWIFNGEKNSFPSGVFISKKTAEKWIHENKLSGILTSYPLDIGVYNWAIENNYFIPKKDLHYKAEFIQNFSSAYLEHYHYENGVEPE